MFKHYNGVVLEDTPLVDKGVLRRQDLVCVQKEMLYNYVVKSSIGRGLVAKDKIMLFSSLKRDSNFVYYSGSKRNLKYMYQLYAEVPYSVHNIIVDAGYYIILTPDDFSALWHTGEKLADIVLSATQQIVLTNSRMSLDLAFYHAIGHALDFALGVKSSTEEFQRIWKEEQDEFHAVDAYDDWSPIDNAVEFFASVFHNIMKTGDLYEVSAPKAYAYVRDCMKGGM